MRIFLVTWLGQLISVVGSGLTSFAVSVRVYQDTGSATQLSLLTFCYVFPAVVLSPFAGALVDRWDRRRAMLVSDLGAGIGVVFLAALLAAWQAGLCPLRPWYVFLPIMQISAFGALRWPAYQAATALLVPRRHLGRANGMIELATGVGQLVAPMLAAVLVVRIGLLRVILIDIATFAVAILSLLPLRFPAPPVSTSERRRSLREELADGFRYVGARPGLVGLLGLISFINVVLGVVCVLVTPLVLSVAGVSALGVTFTIAGVGMLFGGILMSAWGGPKRRLLGVLGPLALAGVVLFVGALRPSVPLIAACCAAFLFCVPVITGSASAIWQTKVTPGLQGRVFAVRRMITFGATALANLMAGPLADRWFEPWLAPGGILASSVGRLIGTGPGRGIGFLFIVMGASALAVVLAAVLTPRFRNMEDDMPDALPDDEASVQPSVSR
jgi:MFS family permease